MGEPLCGEGGRNLEVRETSKFYQFVRENEQMLYPNCRKYINDQVSPKCGTSRWKTKDEDVQTNEIKTSQKRKNLPAKILRWFPLKPRLQRLFMSYKVNESMRWHHKGVAFDGFNPFKTMSITHSTWFVMIIPYNTPPWMCMKQSFLMLSLLISGPKGPGNNIDVYLQSLVQELQDLWENKIKTFDTYNKETFQLHDVIMWTINDFPAYANLSGWSTKGVAFDGFNPFKTMSITHSTWFVMIIPYNTPPWMCMKQSFLMLSLLISGPKGPGNNIDVYLQSLVQELQDLWENKIKTFDTYNKETFQLHDVIMWTINDFPAYANLSGWSTKGVAFDGFNPFKTMSITHSTWFVMIIPYNTPPWMCMKQSFLMLSLLISGPKGPGNNIDVYLQSLVQELQDLWENKIKTFDTYNKETFQLHDVIMWTINDFPAYANLSGWSTKDNVSFLHPIGIPLGSKRQQKLQLGKRKRVSRTKLDNKELAQAHKYVLSNCDAGAPFIEEHITVLKRQFRPQRLSQLEIDKQHGQKFIEWFPQRVVRRYIGYAINGFRFHTKKRERYLKTQNSEVVVKTKTSKDEIDYFGQLTDIIQLDYSGKYNVLLFKCN
ncbi:uncharacterized protein [Cicer arietinum]|uniref:uncharacterized protein n=1 Tax=Cicer arietinum TaxID=3827 RepID=UPI003CC51545